MENQLESLKKTYKHLAYINNKMLTTQFYLEEMVAADEAMKFITEFGNKIVTQIEELEPKEPEATPDAEVINE